MPSPEPQNTIPLFIIKTFLISFFNLACEENKLTLKNAELKNLAVSKNEKEQQKIEPEETPTDKYIFLSALKSHLDSSPDLKNLAHFYEKEFIKDVGPRVQKAVSSYLLVHSDMETREFKDIMHEDYKKRKEQFKARLSSLLSNDSSKTLEELEMFYAEFIKNFISEYSTYFKKSFFNKIRNQVILDEVDKAFFWMYFDSTNLVPFQIKSKEIDFKIIPLNKTGDLVILCGEKQDTGVTYTPYFFEALTKQVYRSNNDQGHPPKFLVGYAKNRNPMVGCQNDCIIYHHEGIAYEYAFDIGRKIWIQTAEEWPIL